MAEQKFNLSEVYSKFFGVKAIPFPLLVAQNGINNPFEADRFKNIIDSLSGKRKSSYSGQVMDRLKIGNYYLPNEPLIDLDFSKNIITTELLNYEGTIKESINTSDWGIKIRGIIIGETEDDYPKDELTNFLSICKKNESLTVESEYLSIFEIFYLVIKDIRLPAFEGARHIQPYEISAISDRLVELLIREEQTQQGTNESGTVNSTL